MGFPWRVSRGVVRFDTAAADDGELSFAGLAMEGDLVGTEFLMFGRFAHRATALTPCQLEPWPGRLDQAGPACSGRWPVPNSAPPTSSPCARARPWPASAG